MKIASLENNLPEPWRGRMQKGNSLDTLSPKINPRKPLVLFVPGSGEDIDSRDYRAVLSAIEQRGYRTQFVPIKWARTTPEKWRTQLMEEYAKHDAHETILAGFSFGAVTALLAAAERNPAALWLCSLSPYFAENFAHEYMKTSWLNYLGKRRVDEFRHLSFEALAAKVSCPTQLYYGEEEFQKFPIMKRQSELAQKDITDAVLYIAPHAGHDVTNTNYLQTIHSTI